MTYIPTWTGFLYLAMVIDVYSRKVVGWAFGERMTAELVIEALNMAPSRARELQNNDHCWVWPDEQWSGSVRIQVLCY